MPVVHLHRASDDADWTLTVGDEHTEPDGVVTSLTVEQKALLVANGNLELGISPGNGEPGWEIVEVLP